MIYRELQVFFLLTSSAIGEVSTSGQGHLQCLALLLSREISWLGSMMLLLDRSDQPTPLADNVLIYPLAMLHFLSQRPPRLWPTVKVFSGQFMPLFIMKC